MDRYKEHLVHLAQKHLLETLGKCLVDEVFRSYGTAAGRKKWGNLTDDQAVSQRAEEVGREIFSKIYPLLR